MSEFRRRLMMQSKTDNPILIDYLTIVALEDGLTAKLSTNACEYCVNGDGIWKTLPANTYTEPINAGQTLSFRGNLTPTSNNGIGTFTVSKYFNLKGNCMSMLFGDEGKSNFSLVGKNWAFSLLFNGCLVVDASELSLPATELSAYCYYYMFANCKNMIVAPKLIAKKLSNHAYSGMFRLCTSLIEAPELPANIIAWGAYNNMFQLCSKLNYIKALFTTTPGTNYTNSWLQSVSTTGTFVKSKDATWDVRGTSGVPEGWNVITE